MAAFSDPYALRCSRLGAEHAAANLHIELGRGVTSLWAIACTAPLLGMFGTAVTLRSALHSVPGCGYGDCAGGVAETFVPFALSLPVAVLASGGFHYLRQQIDDFDLEMHAGILNLPDHLGRRHPGR
jgi:biopolymer transport protein ExbB/TolQ